MFKKSSMSNATAVEFEATTDHDAWRGDSSIHSVVISELIRDGAELLPNPRASTIVRDNHIRLYQPLGLSVPINIV